MSEIIVQEAGADPRKDPPVLERVPSRPGEAEWLRGPLSRETSYRLLVSGDMGPKEIGKLIRVLKAQKAVLSDDDTEEDGGSGEATVPAQASGEGDGT